MKSTIVMPKSTKTTPSDMLMTLDLTITENIDRNRFALVVRTDPCACCASVQSQLQGDKVRLVRLGSERCSKIANSRNFTQMTQKRRNTTPEHPRNLQPSRPGRTSTNCSFHEPT